MDNPLEPTVPMEPLPPMEEATVEQAKPHKLVYRAGDHEKDVLKFIEMVLVDRYPAQFQFILPDLRGRKNLGVKKYGTSLRAFNGRDALIDAYQESLDAVMYGTQAAMEEGPDSDFGALIQGVTTGAIKLAADLSLLIRARKGEVKLVATPKPSEPQDSTEPQTPSHPESSQTPSQPTTGASESAATTDP